MDKETTMKLKLLGKKIILEKYGKIVIEQELKLPNGLATDFILWGGKASPAIVFALTADDKVIAIKQLRIAASVAQKKETWVIELPGGNPLSDESIAVVARRELLEETGYKAGKIKKLAPVWLEPTTCLTNFTPVFAQNCQYVQKPQLGKSEILKPVLFPLKKWVKLIKTGMIDDSKTIATTFLSLMEMGYFKTK